MLICVEDRELQCLYSVDVGVRDVDIQALGDMLGIRSIIVRGQPLEEDIQVIVECLGSAAHGRCVRDGQAFWDRSGLFGFCSSLKLCSAADVD